MLIPNARSKPHPTNRVLSGDKAPKHQQHRLQSHRPEHEISSVSLLITSTCRGGEFWRSAILNLEQWTTKVRFHKTRLHSKKTFSKLLDYNWHRRPAQQDGQVLLNTEASQRPRQRPRQSHAPMTVILKFKLGPLSPHSRPWVGNTVSSVPPPAAHIDA